MDGSSPCREVASIDEAEEVEVDIASLRLRYTERRGASLLTAIAVLIISLFGYPAAQNAKQAVVRERSARSSSGAGLFISEQLSRRVESACRTIAMAKSGGGQPEHGLLAPEMLASESDS